MSKAEKSNTDQHQFWQMVLETFKSSGLSVRQFCSQEGLSEPSFYAWRKRLTQPQTSDIEQEEQPSPFIQVSMPNAKSGGVELILASGHTLLIHSDVDSQVLTGVLSALKQAKLC
ncbi:MAG TPA: hypothetical protein ENO00_09685 [Deltaproteobacteria bacterium]|nr:hypothetical protein [Deltaproteobacteria bacterium]